MGSLEGRGLDVTGAAVLRSVVRRSGVSTRIGELLGTALAMRQLLSYLLDRHSASLSFLDKLLIPGFQGAKEEERGPVRPPLITTGGELYEYSHLHQEGCQAVQLLASVLDAQ